MVVLRAEAYLFSSNFTFHASLEFSAGNSCGFEWLNRFKNTVIERMRLGYWIGEAQHLVDRSDPVSNVLKLLFPDNRCVVRCLNTVGTCPNSSLKLH